MYKYNLKKYLRLRKHGKSSDQTIHTSSEILIINAIFPRVHLHQWIPHHILDKRTNVYLSQYEPQ